MWTPPEVLILRPGQINCDIKSTNDRQENLSGDMLSAQEIFKIKARVDPFGGLHVSLWFRTDPDHLLELPTLIWIRGRT